MFPGTASDYQVGRILLQNGTLLQLETDSEKNMQIKKAFECDGSGPEDNTEITDTSGSALVLKQMGR